MKAVVTPQTIWKNPIHFLAYGLGSGAAPIAPGTAGTLAAIPFYLICQEWPLSYYLILLLVMTVFGIWICDVTAKDAGVHDHPGIVWDEFTGYFITMTLAPTGFIWVVIGFILFRLFDIWKPWPISWVNNNVMGGWGIMVDDILAAILAWGVLQGLAWLLVY